MLSNFHAEQPHRHAVYYTSVLVAEQAWTKLDLAQCMDGKLVLQPGYMDQPFSTILNKKKHFKLSSSLNGLYKLLLFSLNKSEFDCIVHKSV